MVDIFLNFTVESCWICLDSWCFNKWIFRNIPHIHVHEKRENKERWHGAEIQIVIEGNWTKYRVRFSKLTLTGGSVCYELQWLLSFMIFFFPSAVENTALHAANGCHYTICTISFQVSFRNSGVHALSLPEASTFISYCHLKLKMSTNGFFFLFIFAVKMSLLDLQGEQI